MTTDRTGHNTVITPIRTIARILGLLFAGFLLFMFIGESLQSNPNSSSDPIAPIAAISLVLMGIYVVAMFLALKWELASSLVGAAGLGGFFVIMFLGLLPGNVSGGFTSRGVLNPIFLALWVPIVLYLLCWGLERLGRERPETNR